MVQASTLTHMRSKVIIQITIHCLCWVMLFIVFWPALRFMANRWVSVPEMNHGVLVPFISIYCILKTRNALSSISPTIWLGTVILLASLGLLILAVWADIGLLYSISLPTAIIGLCGLLYGMGWVKAHQFALAFLFMAVPWPDFLIDKLSVPMQHFSAAASGTILHLIMPIEREGVHMWTPKFDAQISMACSGIRSFMAITTVAALMAASMNTSRLRQWLLFFGAIPIALIANVVRITMIYIVGHYIDKDFALAMFHDSAGIILLVITGWILNTARQWMVTHYPTKTELKPQDGIPHTSHLIPRVVVTLVLLLSARWVIAITEASDHHTPTVPINTLDVPYTIGNWITTDVNRLPNEAVELLTPDAVINRTYRHTSGKYCDVLIVYGHRKNSFHSPSYCLPGDGWNLQNEYRFKVLGTRTAIPFRAMLMEKASSRILIIYSYIQGDAANVGLVRHNMGLAVKRLHRQPAMGAMVRLMIPMENAGMYPPDCVISLCQTISAKVQHQLSATIDKH